MLQPQGHTATEWPGWDSDLSRPALECTPCLLGVPRFSSLGERPVDALSSLKEPSPVPAPVPRAGCPELKLEVGGGGSFLHLPSLDPLQRVQDAIPGRCHSNLCETSLERPRM